MADPFFTSVVSLLNFENMADGTTITDVIGDNSWTAVGDAAVSSSLLVLDGAGDYLTEGVTGDWNFLHDGTEDYTIDIKFTRSTAGSSDTLLDSGGGSISKVGIYLFMYTTGDWLFRICNGNGAQSFSVNSLSLPTGSEIGTDEAVISVEVRGGTDATFYVNGELKATESNVFANSTSDHSDIFTLGKSQTQSTLDFGGTVTAARITKDLRYSGSHTPDSTPYPENADDDIYIADSGPLRLPASYAESYSGLASAPGPLALPASYAESYSGLVSDSGPLQSPSALGSILFGDVSVPSILNAVNVVGWSDFSGFVSGVPSKYVLRLMSTPVVEIPISSWQATLQSDRQNYVQSVVPASGQYYDALAASVGVDEMVIYRTTVIDGSEVEKEMARTTLDTVVVNRGSFRETATLSGYSDPTASAPALPTTELTGLRSITQTLGGNIRVRCDIDWNLLPTQSATAEGSTFTVTYINYYMTSVGDAYMDVGSR